MSRWAQKIERWTDTDEGMLRAAYLQGRLTLPPGASACLPSRGIRCRLTLLLSTTPAPTHLHHKLLARRQSAQQLGHKQAQRRVSARTGRHCHRCRGSRMGGRAGKQLGTQHNLVSIAAQSVGTAGNAMQCAGEVHRQMFVL